MTDQSSAVKLQFQKGTNTWIMEIMATNTNPQQAMRLTVSTISPCFSAK